MAPHYRQLAVDDGRVHRVPTAAGAEPGPNQAREAQMSAAAIEVAGRATQVPRRAIRIAERVAVQHGPTMVTAGPASEMPCVAIPMARAFNLTLRPTTWIVERSIGAAGRAIGAAGRAIGGAGRAIG